MIKRSSTKRFSNDTQAYFEVIFYDFSLGRLPGTPNANDMFWDHIQLTNHPIYLSVGLLNTGLLDASSVKIKFEFRRRSCEGYMYCT